MNIDKFIEIGKEIGLLGVKVSVNNTEIAVWHREPEYRRNVYSVSKSFTAIAIGWAIEEGLINLQEKLVDVFPEDLPEEISDNLQKATVRDLLTMCLGQEEAALMGDQRPAYEEENWIKLSLRIPFLYEPGTHFQYSNVGPYLAGILLQRRAGCDMVEYLMPRLFKPLGIRRPTWEVDPQGNTFGAGGLFLTLSELHKFGLFCLNRGKWDGKQLIDASWIDECVKAQDKAGYGYLFWRGQYRSYRADGSYSQICMVLPEKKAVITLVSECRESEKMLKAIYEHICKKIEEML